MHNLNVIWGKPVHFVVEGPEMEIGVLRFYLKRYNTDSQMFMYQSACVEGQRLMIELSRVIQYEAAEAILCILQNANPKLSIKVHQP